MTTCSTWAEWTVDRRRKKEPLRLALGARHPSRRDDVLARRDCEDQPGRPRALPQARRARSHRRPSDPTSSSARLIVRKSRASSAAIPPAGWRAPRTANVPCSAITLARRSPPASTAPASLYELLHLSEHRRCVREHLHVEVRLDPSRYPVSRFAGSPPHPLHSPFPCRRTQRRSGERWCRCPAGKRKSFVSYLPKFDVTTRVSLSHKRAGKRERRQMKRRYLVMPLAISILAACDGTAIFIPEDNKRLGGVPNFCDRKVKSFRSSTDCAPIRY